GNRGHREALGKITVEPVGGFCSGGIQQIIAGRKIAEQFREATSWAKFRIEEVPAVPLPVQIPKAEIIAAEFRQVAMVHRTTVAHTVQNQVTETQQVSVLDGTAYIVVLEPFG